MTVVLGIESSCDETAIALVNGEGRILAQALATQREEHAAYGGVVPEIAARAHLVQIDALYKRALADSGLTLKDVDAIAATAGPGLIGGVIVGVMVGKALAAACAKPFIAINHLEGHALTVRMTHQAKFPYFLLLVSGGHCQMLLVRGVGQYEQLGTTRDDALGEAFDKCAKLLGLPYPGGPAIERAALKGNPMRYKLPQPMTGTEHCDFSFSGLKTAVRLLVAAEVEREGTLTQIIINDIAASFQRAVVEVLKDRLSGGLRAASVKPTALAVAGGVAANQYIGNELASLAREHGLPLLIAPKELCTDNAAMIAWAGIEHLSAGKTDSLSIEPRARWPLAG